MRIYPRKEINIANRCGSCNHYKPVIKVDCTKILTEFARGKCLLTDRLKQRTETCKKYDKVS